MRAADSSKDLDCMDLDLQGVCGGGLLVPESSLALDVECGDHGIRL